MVRHNLRDIDSELRSHEYSTPCVIPPMEDMEGNIYTISEVKEGRHFVIYRLKGYRFSFIEEYLKLVSSPIDVLIEDIASYDELSSFLKDSFH